MNPLQSLLAQYPGTLLLDGRETSSVNCMPDYEGRVEDILDFEFYEGDEDNAPVVAVTCSRGVV